MVDVLASQTSPQTQAPAPEPVPARPTPESELTTEQRRIRDLENQLALERGRNDPEPELEAPTTPGDSDNICIHFVADGLSVLGRVWFVGQELEFVPGSQAYRDTCDRYGRSWLDLRDNPAGQEARWGEVKFRPGRWPGKRLAEATGVRWEPLKPLKDGQTLTPTEEELRKAEQAEARRNRAAPRLPMR